MRLTPWFRSPTKPVHAGVYRTRFWFFVRGDGERGYSYWDGNRWSIQYESVEQAALDGRYFSDAGQRKDWRGLTQPAE